MALDGKHDDLVHAALEIREDIRRAYRLHEENRPVMPLHIQEDRIYAYPYMDYKATLSERSQAVLEQQCEEAQQENKIVVFVRDEATRRLTSFSMWNCGTDCGYRTASMPWLASARTRN